MTGSESRILESKILGNDQIAREIYCMTLEYEGWESEMKPGQFVNLYLNDKSMILPRPVSICEAEKGKLALVYRIVGKGTEALSSYAPGDIIRVSTPLGNGYDVTDIALRLGTDSSKTIVLAAGGLGVPPMLELAKSLRKAIEPNIKLTAVIGFQDEVFLCEELEQYCDSVLVATDNGSKGFHGNVLELMKAEGDPGDYYLACGPKPMLKAVSDYCVEKNIPIQVSLEERMGCGYGACVGCTCRIKEENDEKVPFKLKKVCKDGPVFRGNEVVWDD
ncbi:dihydroorotate dehydrogenase electron transfer subunit [Anoxybacterium hadale]|uniref:Dihydroorotate dehydrogenase electron transfer subunit n=1 Tax=Anoxybacterium hadale TaxID=3408580 RepID=A0ACD1A7D4_9FIRM|nr:dihydroorotate dehydrogenase electron transfer subunit [Clostridiales bacterium]